MEFDFNRGDRELFYCLNGRGGSFSTALYQTIMKADINNMEKLRMGFPEEVNAVEMYRNEPEYWNELQKHMGV